jgi:tetratricopeptide (TPR) repeat protein
LGLRVLVFKKRENILILSIALLVSSTVFSCGKKEKKRRKKRSDPMVKSEKLIKEGRYLDALDLLNRVRKSKKNDKKFWNRYGMVLRYNSFLESDVELRIREIKAFKKALKIDSDFSIARMNLASALWETGKREIAIKEYKKLLKLNPSFKGAASIKKRLASHEEKKKRIEDRKIKRKEKKAKELELKKLNENKEGNPINSMLAPVKGKVDAKKVVPEKKKVKQN